MPKPRHIHVVAAQIRSGAGSHSDKRIDPNEKFLKEFEEEIMTDTKSETKDTETKKVEAVTPAPDLGLVTLANGEQVKLGCLLPPVESEPKAKKSKKTK